MANDTSSDGPRARTRARGAAPLWATTNEDIARELGEGVAAHFRLLEACTGLMLVLLLGRSRRWPIQLGYRLRHLHTIEQHLYWVNIRTKFFLTYSV
jgi:hypothetical protein